MSESSSEPEISEQPSQPIDLKEIELGIGTWAWGDRLFWNYGRGYSSDDLRDAYNVCVQGGVRLFDTAEVYAQGKSEAYLGEFMHKNSTPVYVATKFMPFPWRWTGGSLLRALRGSLKRLGLRQVDLYQLHMPLPPVNVDTWMNAMAEAVHQGLTRQVGVSNYDAEKTQRAYDVLAREGVPLAANQVEFNLLNRKVEKAGLLGLCADLGARVIAYSPLAMGVLSGKYTPENPPQGARGQRYNRALLEQIQPLLAALRRIGNAHDGLSSSQVALNWIICKGALPIPGVKTASQAEQNLGATGWRLTDEEVAELDALSDPLS